MVLPYGVVVQPFAPVGHGESPMPVVDLSVSMPASPAPLHQTSGGGSIFGALFGSDGKSGAPESSPVVAPLQAQATPSYKALPPRCGRCGGYMNCFVSFSDSGNKWHCNMCQMENDVPNWYYCGLDGAGNRLDRALRTELHRGSLEYIVSPEDYAYKKLPPVPTYIFAIDISLTAVTSGYAHACVQAIQLNIKSLPDNARVGICTYHSSIQLFQYKHLQTLKKCPMSRQNSHETISSKHSFGESECQFTVFECETADPFPGLPYDYWVLELAEYFDFFSNLLQALHSDEFLMKLQPPLRPNKDATVNKAGTLHKDNHDYAVSPAAVLKLIQQTLRTQGVSNAKAFLFTAGCTGFVSSAFGFVPPREQLALYGKPDEILTYGDATVAGTVCKDEEVRRGIETHAALRDECVEDRLSIDIFAYADKGGEYRDIPMFSELCGATGGSVYHVEGNFKLADTSGRLEVQLLQAILKLAGCDVAMKLRTSIGFAPASYHGCGQFGEGGIVTLSSIATDTCSCFTLKNNATLKDEQPVYVQMAVLYTAYVHVPMASSGNGTTPFQTAAGHIVPQRRVRILNLCCFCSNDPQLVFRHLDGEAVAACMFKQAIDLCRLRASFFDSKEAGSVMKSVGSVLGSGHSIDTSKDAVGAIEYITTTLVRTLTQYRALCLPPEKATNMNKIMLPDTLRYLPLYCLGMIKHPALVSNKMAKSVRINVRGHERAFYLAAGMQAGVGEIVHSLYPRLYALHQLTPDDGELISVQYVKNGHERQHSGSSVPHPSDTAHTISDPPVLGRGVSGEDARGNVSRSQSFANLTRTTSCSSLGSLEAINQVMHNGIASNSLGVLNSLHTQEGAVAGDEVMTKLPDRVLPPSSEVLDSDGLYLVDDGHILWVYVGRTVAQVQLERWFSNMKSPYYSDKRSRVLEFNANDPEAARMHNIVAAVARSHVAAPEVRFIFADEPANADSNRFQLRLVEDSIYGELSYAEFFSNMQNSIKKYRDDCRSII